MSYLFMLTFDTYFKRTIRFSRAIWFFQFLSRFQLLLQARVKGGGWKGRGGGGGGGERGQKKQLKVDKRGVGMCHKRGDEKSSLVTFFKKST